MLKKTVALVGSAIIGSTVSMVSNAATIVLASDRSDAQLVLKDIDASDTGRLMRVLKSLGLNLTVTVTDVSNETASRKLDMVEVIQLLRTTFEEAANVNEVSPHLMQLSSQAFSGGK